MGNRWFTNCAALAAIAMTASGCGGDDNDATTQAAVTRAEYVQSVKARCAQYSKDRTAAEQPLQALFKGVSDPSQIQPAKLKAAADRIAALDDTTRQVLADLTPDRAARRALR